MNLGVFTYKSAWIGFIISAPIGPIGMLCIRYALDYGVRAGFMVGLGNSVVKAGYSMIAALGLGAFLNNYEIAVKGFGGILLLYLAYQNFKSAKKIDTSPEKSGAPFWLAAGLTVVNPMTILALIAAFVSIDLVPQTSFEVATIGFGMMIGSMIWWSVLSICIAQLKHSLSQRTIIIIKQISAGLIAAFGLINLKNSLLLLVHSINIK